MLIYHILLNQSIQLLTSYEVNYFQAFKAELDIQLINRNFKKIDILTDNLSPASAKRLPHAFQESPHSQSLCFLNAV